MFPNFCASLKRQLPARTNFPSAEHTNQSTMYSFYLKMRKKMDNKESKFGEVEAVNIEDI